VAAARARSIAQAGQYADIVALGTRSRDFFAQQIEWLHAAAGERFEKIEIACYMFVVPENRPEAVANVAAIVQRSFGFDLQQAIADNAPNVLQGSASAMIEQLEERRATFGLTYVVLGAYDADAFAPIMQRVSGV
jgi:alkanesulfonate monooxygenase SsuD/methylene tetrahydromethanopterin reductase-like flavin-dependent oxidoreductase (luciferase family)